MLRGIFGIPALLAVIAGPAASLEKMPARAPDIADFRAGSTIEVSYFNLCTGWVWNWIGPPPLASYGVFYRDLTSETERLLRTHIYYAQGAPAGYGYTSTARVLRPFTPRCPEIQPLAFDFFLPRTGWNTIEWNGAEGVAVESFFILVTHSDVPGNPTVIVTEKGEPGENPGGCGVCYPPSRPPFSFQFGQEATIICPGLPWSDEAACSLELLWRTEIRLGLPTSVESASWGKVKSLYR
jgi:hypothetical protein